MRKIRAAIKYILFVVTTLGLYSVWFICTFFIPEKRIWRQIIFHNWAKSFVWVSQMRVEVVGNAPEPPFFLVCNHLSYADVAALRVAAKGVFVAKGEMETWFLAGRIVRDMGTIFINRQNRRDIPRAGREIVNRLDDGEGVIVFPEGTSTKGEEILPFNSSFLEFAAQKDLPVSYAAISYRTPAGEMSAAEIVCWWDEKTFGEHLWHLFQLKKYTAIITFGEKPIHNSDRKILARELREKVREKYNPVI